MKKAIYAAALAAAAALAPQQAQAADIKFDEIDLTNVPDAFGGLVDVGAFDLSFSFVLAADGFLDVTFVDNYLSGITYSEVKLGGISLLTGAAPYFTAGLAPTFFTAGNYSLTVKGTNGSTHQAAFVGLIDVSPVPEPATWAMMVVGVAAIGTAMRRRNQNVRVSFS